MIVATSLLLAVQAAPADPFEAAAARAFRASCERVKDWQGLVEDVKAQGWMPVRDGTVPGLERVSRFQTQGLTPEHRWTQRSYGRNVMGRSVYLMISRLEFGTGPATQGCRLYDFDAAAAWNQVGLEAVIGAASSEVTDLGEGAVRIRWQPGFGTAERVTYYHVPLNSSHVAETGLSGAVLSSSADGEAAKVQQ